MRTLATILLALSAALLAVGCGDGDEPASPATPTTTTTAGAGDALVVYERAGGVAYTEQRLVVERDGSAAVDVGGPEGFEERFRLDDVAMDALNGLLRNAEADLEDPPGLTGCADCYEYTISHGREVASFDNTDMTAALHALVAFVDDLIARETPTGPARGGE